MDRRSFLFGLFAAATVVPGGLLAQAPLVRKLERSRKTVGTPIPRGRLRTDFTVWGWHVELEEDDDVIWRLLATNPGPLPARAVYCKPFTTGPWQIVERFPVPAGSSAIQLKEWRADNEDHFFFFEVRRREGWRPINAAAAQHAWRDPTNRVAHMEWHQPQELRLEVRLRGV